MTKAKIIIFSIVCIVLILSFFSSPAIAETREKNYPKIAIVFNSIKTNNNWEIYCIDRSQNVWTFYDKKGTWEKGDIINLSMQTVDENEQHDKILKVKWEGYTDNIDLWMEISGWR